MIFDSGFLVVNLNCWLKRGLGSSFGSFFILPPLPQLTFPTIFLVISTRAKTPLSHRRGRERETESTHLRPPNSLHGRWFYFVVTRFTNENTISRTRNGYISQLYVYFIQKTQSFDFGEIELHGGLCVTANVKLQFRIEWKIVESRVFVNFIENWAQWF